MSLKRETAILSLILSLMVPLASAQEDDEDLSLESLLDLGDVEVVSATKTAQKQSEAPSIVSVISKRQIELYGYKSVAEALKTVPGLYVSTDHVFYDVGVRGVTGEIRGGSRLIKVLVNMQPVAFRAETINALGPELIPIEAVENIEVIRGPGSALYGANAFLGVINIVTKKGESLDGSKASIVTQSFNGKLGYGVSAMTGKKVGSTDYFAAVSYGHYDRSGLKLNCTTHSSCEDQKSTRNEEAFKRESFDDISQPLSLIATVESDYEKGGILKFIGYYQGLDSRGNFSDWGLLNFEEGKKGSGNRVALTNWFLSAQYTNSISDVVSFDLGFRYTEGRPSSKEQLRDQIATNDVNNWERKEYGNKSKDYFAEVRFFAHELLGLDWLNDFTLMLGYDHTTDTIDYNSDVGLNNKLRFVSDDLKTNGIYSQLLLSTWENRLGFVVGYRVDDHVGADVSSKDLDDEVESGLCGKRVCYKSTNSRVGMTLSVYQGDRSKEGESPTLLNKVYLKILQGTAFKAPAPNLLYNEGYLGQLPFNSNPGLKEQTVSSTEFLLGMEMMDESFATTVTYYENVIEDKAEFGLAGLSKIEASNGSRVTASGLEVSASYSQQNWNVLFGYSGQDGERDVSSSGRERVKKPFGFPDDKYSLGLSYFVQPAKLVTALEHTVIGDIPGFPLNKGSNDDAANGYTLPGYSVTNLTFSSRGLKLFGDKKTKLALSVNNLFDTEFSYPGYHYFYQVDIPGEPRTFVATFGQFF